MRPGSQHWKRGRNPSIRTGLLLLASAAAGIAGALFASRRPETFLLAALVVAGMVLTFFACSILMSRSFSRWGRSGQAQSSLKHQGSAFFLWFTGHNLFWAVLGLSAICCSMILFGPVSWVLIFAAGALACSCFSLAGLIKPGGTDILGLCWRAPVTTPGGGFLRRAATTVLLKERYAFAIAHDLSTRPSVLPALTRILDLAAVGGSARPVNLIARRVTTLKGEALRRLETMSVLFLATILFALLGGIRGGSWSDFNGLPRFLPPSFFQNNQANAPPDNNRDEQQETPNQAGSGAESEQGNPPDDGGKSEGTGENGSNGENGSSQNDGSSQSDGSNSSDGSASESGGNGRGEESRSSDSSGNNNLGSEDGAVNGDAANAPGENPGDPGESGSVAPSAGEGQERGSNGESGAGQTDNGGETGADGRGQNGTEADDNQGGGNTSGNSREPGNSDQNGQSTGSSPGKKADGTGKDGGQDGKSSSGEGSGTGENGDVSGAEKPGQGGSGSGSEAKSQGAGKDSNSDSSSKSSGSSGKPGSGKAAKSETGFGTGEGPPQKPGNGSEMGMPSPFSDARNEIITLDLPPLVSSLNETEESDLHPGSERPASEAPLQAAKGGDGRERAKNDPRVEQPLPNWVWILLKKKQ